MNTNNKHKKQKTKNKNRSEMFVERLARDKYVTKTS